jgi:hypothetical protein
MRLKKLGAALFVVAALGAVLASSAFAGSDTHDVLWYTGTAPGTVLTGSEEMSSTIVGASATFSTTVGSTPYVLESTGIECVGCKIENSGGVAVGSGHLKFKGVTVKEPAGCSVASEIETTALSVTADWMPSEIVIEGGKEVTKAKETGPSYIKFTPTAGETTEFAQVVISGCALATTLVPKGSVFVESANATGTQAVEQEVHSSAAINTAAGGSLKVGTKTASLTGSAKFKMKGAKVGIAFGTH